MIRMTALMGALLLCTLPARAERHALLVGNSMGGSGNQRLKYVANDLNQMRATLTGVCGFAPERVMTVRDGGVAAIEEALTTLHEQVSSGGDDLFLFYYSGHADDSALRLGDERLLLTDLKARLAALPARIRVAVFDACQSGSFARLKGGRLAEPFLFASDAKVEGYVVLSSSSANENSQESDALRHSVFTFHVVNALRGSADASGDGKVTLNEAYQYAYNRTVTSTVHSSGGVQHPTYRFEIKGEGDIVLADLNLRSSGLLLGTDVSGRVTVVDSTRSVVADLDKERGSSVMVALERGPYDITARQGEVALAASAVVEKGQVVKLSIGQFRRASSEGQGRAKGERIGDSWVGFSIGVGYRRAGQSSLNRTLAGDYEPFSALGLETAPAVGDDYFNPWLGVEACVRGRLVIGVDICLASGSAEGGDRQETLNAADSLVYLSALDWRVVMELYGVSPGVGYRVDRGPLRNLVLRLGVDFTRVGFTYSSRYQDALYDVDSRLSMHNTGILLTPSLSASYAYPVTTWLSVGAMVRYRVQVGSNELALSRFESNRPATSGAYSYDSADPDLRYDADGLDARVGVTFTVGKGR